MGGASGAMAVLILVLKYPTYNLAPETGAWIIGDGESLPFRKFPLCVPGLKRRPKQAGGKYAQKREEDDADSIS